MALSEKEEYIAQCITAGKTREECEQLWNEAHATKDQQTKEEYISECVAGGKTQAECEAAWNEAHQGGADYATLVRENKMQAVKLAQTRGLLKEALDIIKRVNSERDAIKDARKYELAVEIERDTLGKIKHTDSMKESLESLTIMKRAIDQARPETLVSVAHSFGKDSRKRAPQLTVGEYDPDTKQYRGGSDLG